MGIMGERPNPRIEVIRPEVEVLPPDHSSRNPQSVDRECGYRSTRTGGRGESSSRNRDRSPRSSWCWRSAGCSRFRSWLRLDSLPSCWRFRHRVGGARCLRADSRCPQTASLNRKRGFTSPCGSFQATFLVLVRRAASVRVGDSLGRWLYGVSRRVAAKARARSHRARIRMHPLTVEPTATDATSGSVRVVGGPRR